MTLRATVLLALFLGAGCAELKQVHEFVKGEPPPFAAAEDLPESEETPLDRRLAALWNYLTGEAPEEAVTEGEAGTDEIGALPEPDLDPIRAETVTLPELEPGPPPPARDFVVPVQEALSLEPAGCPSEAELARFRYDSARRALQVRNILAARREGRQIDMPSCQ